MNLFCSKGYNHLNGIPFNITWWLGPKLLKLAWRFVLSTAYFKQFKELSWEALLTVVICRIIKVALVYKSYK